jgi:hypothetical protein
VCRSETQFLERPDEPDAGGRMIIRPYSSGIDVLAISRARDRFLPVIAMGFSLSYHRVTPLKTL